MKKRILSIALVAVMIVAMIPAMLIPTAAIGYYDGYDGATVTVGAIEVDGDATPDAAYLAGEKIINRLTYDNRNSSGETSSFEGYIAEDGSGFYFWISVVDQSLDKGDYTKEVTDEETGDTTVLPQAGANDGDRVELYLRADSAAAQSLGVIGFDYLGQLHLNARYGKLDKDLITLATSETETGWVGELYVPWAALNDGFAEIDTDNITSFQMGIQCNNMTNDGTSAHRAYSYDSKAGGQYYRGMFSNHSWASGDNNTGFQGSLFVPVNFVGYKTAVVANALTVDGVMDAAYAKSEKITSAAIKGDVAQPFTAYAVATLDGLYVYADIIDSTLDKAADATVDAQDKFQVYFQVGNHFSNTNWGYIEMDYTTDDTTANFRYVNKGSAWHGDAPADASILRAFTTNETGWTAELFFPWTGDVALDGLNEFSTQIVSIMLQTNDGTTGIGYSNAYGGRAWYGNNGGSGGPSGNFWFAPLTFVFDEDVDTTTARYAKYVDAITLDGVKDDKYSDLAGDKVNHVYVQEPEVMGYPTKEMTHNVIDMASVYYAFTDTDMYIFVEVYDDTVSPTKTYEYVSIYYSTDNYAGKFNLGATGEFGNPSCYEGISRDYILLNGTNADTANLALTYVGTKNNYTGYNIEFKMALDEADKAALAAGEAISVAVGVEINNAKENGSRIAYGYSAANGGSWWVSDIGKGYMCMPQVRLDKDYELAVEDSFEFSGASVSLDGSINVNYYATSSYDIIGNAQVKFEQNGKVFYANAKSTATPGEYKFVFEGIAPQAIGDNISATLIVDGVELDSIPEYSVLANLKNVKNDSNADLINALVNYCAVAQKYNNYKTDALVSEGFDAVTPVKPEGTLKAPEGAFTAAQITAAGVYHANANKIYVKATVTDPTGIDSVEIGGMNVTAEVIFEGNVGVIYTNAIKATDFDKEYVFALKKNEVPANEDTGDAAIPAETQTLTFSVNDYAFAMWDAEGVAGELAQALYAYGAAAEAYIQ